VTGTLAEYQYLLSTAKLTAESWQQIAICCVPILV